MTVNKAPFTLSVLKRTGFEKKLQSFEVNGWPMFEAVQSNQSFFRLTRSVTNPFAVGEAGTIGHESTHEISHIPTIDHQKFAFMIENVLAANKWLKRIH